MIKIPHEEKQFSPIMASTCNGNHENTHGLSPHGHKTMIFEGLNLSKGLHLTIMHNSPTHNIET